MPRAPKRECFHPSCYVLVDWPENRCDKHRKQQRDTYDKERGNSGERGYDYRWQRVRSLFLKENPLCFQCEKQGITKLAEMVHHIKPITDYPELRLVKSNLMSLCNDCHTEIHRG